MKVTVRDLMTQTPATVPQTATIDEAMQTLLHAQVGEIYVTDATGRLVGAVPDFELLKATMLSTPGQQSVETLMSRNIETTHPDTNVTELGSRFRDGRYRQMAVVEGDRIVGQISRRDLLRLMTVLEQIGEEADMVEGETPAPSTSPEPVPSPQFMRNRQPMGHRTNQ